MIKFYALIFIIGTSATATAQEIEVSGSIKNSEDSTAIRYAVFSLVRAKDSILYKFTRTDGNGHFTLHNIAPGDYLMVASHPKYADLVDAITISKRVDFSNIELTPKSKVLKEIIINTGSPIRIKGDTTIYTADSFVVSANANVEELLKKLPGLQVDKDGTIKAMGEKVQNVLVDGEEFFGSDPGMAVKNIRADAVKEVQVFDKKSEQAEFTGIDDGKTTKTINLKLKENSKHGYFGKVDLAGGPAKKVDDRFLGNLLFGSFKGKRKFSAFLMSGNTGNNGLGWEDEMKYGVADNIEMNIDDGISVMFMGSSDGEVYLSPNDGYLSTTSGGLTYSNKWNDKQSLSISPRYQQQRYENRTGTYTRTQVGDSVLISNSDNQGQLTRHNFKNRAVMDFTIDSMNSVKVTANANFYHTESNKDYTSTSTGPSGNLKNNSERSTSSFNNKSALSGNVLYRHKFRKDRRTLSISGNWNVVDSKGKQFTNSINQSYLDGNNAGRHLIDQMSDNKNSSTNLSGNITYTEPLGKDFSLQVNYKLVRSNGKNQLFTFGRDPVKEEYDSVIDSLSNEFHSDIVQNIPGVVINFSNKTLKLNIGSSLGFTSYHLRDVTYQKDYERHYTNFYPSANLTYKYKGNNSIQFRYTGSTNQPTMNQLQPLRNNNNYYNQYIGNPDLKPAFRHNISINNNHYNFLKQFWTYASLNFSFESNSITNNRIIDLDSGKTTTQPINTNGNFSFNSWGGVGFKLKQLNVAVSFSPSFSYSRYVEMINSEKAISRVFAPAFQISFRKDKNKKYELGISNDIGYNWSSTSQNDAIVKYFTNNLNVWSTLYYKKVWSINLDYTFYTQQPTAFNSNSLNRHLMNGKLQRTFRNDEFTLYMSVNDLLNQNYSRERYIRGSSYSEVTNERLRRYFMIGFSWNFKNKGSQAQK